MIKVLLLRHQRYISPSPLTLPLQRQRQNVPEKKMSTLTPLTDMLWSIILNQLAGYHIRTYESRFDHSETILGPFKKLPFLGPDPLFKNLASSSEPNSTEMATQRAVRILQQHNNANKYRKRKTMTE